MATYVTTRKHLAAIALFRGVWLALGVFGFAGVATAQSQAPPVSALQIGFEEGPVPVTSRAGVPPPPGALPPGAVPVGPPRFAKPSDPPSPNFDQGGDVNGSSGDRPGSLLPGGLAPGGVPLEGLTLPSGAPLSSLLSATPGLLQSSCPSCGGVGLYGCPQCGCSDNHCVPGQDGCGPCDQSTLIGRFFCGIYEAVCCPDPCYEPKWTSLANAGFFVTGVRPVTQSKYGWDHGINVIKPDRAEYFWARTNTTPPTGVGLGPFIPAPFLAEKSVNYNELRMYTEVAIKNVSVIADIPYRSIDPERANHAAGFGDMVFGTKTMLFDSELFQFGFKFLTYTPTGISIKGLGTGHVSLELGILSGIRVGPETYLQAELDQWIPIPIDPNYPGGILHFHLSANQVVFQPMHNLQVIGTLELNGWGFQDGAYTDPNQGPYQQASGEVYLTIGPGIRCNLCDKFDFGMGTQFAITKNHFAEQLFRLECRYQY